MQQHCCGLRAKQSRIRVFLGPVFYLKAFVQVLFFEIITGVHLYSRKFSCFHIEYAIISRWKKELLCTSLDILSTFSQIFLKILNSFSKSDSELFLLQAASTPCVICITFEMRTHLTSWPNYMTYKVWSNLHTELCWSLVLVRKK